MKSESLPDERHLSRQLVRSLNVEAPVRSPCVSICCLDEQDICIGCYRSGDEICSWSSLNNEQRRKVLEQVAIREEKSGRTL